MSYTSDAYVIYEAEQAALDAKTNQNLADNPDLSFQYAHDPYVKEDAVVKTVEKIQGTTVKLNKSTTSIAKDSNETLTATVNPTCAGSVTWDSSDKTVATVNSSGKVSALKAGTTNVTATVAGKTATCAVTVTQ